MTGRKSELLTFFVRGQSKENNGTTESRFFQMRSRASLDHVVLTRAQTARLGLSRFWYTRVRSSDIVKIFDIDELKSRDSEDEVSLLKEWWVS